MGARPRRVLRKGLIRCHLGRDLQSIKGERSQAQGTASAKAPGCEVRGHEAGNQAEHGHLDKARSNIRLWATVRI